MVDKVTLTNLANLQNETTAVNAINANNAAITTAMDNTLSRDGTSPNQMNADFDMNSFHILNLPAAASPLEPIRKEEFDQVVLGTPGQLVVGPNSTLVNHIATWANTTGSSLLDSGVTIGTLPNVRPSNEISYTIQTSDIAKTLQSANTTAAVTWTLQVPSTYVSYFYFIATNAGSKSLTILPTNVGIGKNSGLLSYSLVLAPNQSARIFFDGTDWMYILGVGGQSSNVGNAVYALGYGAATIPSSVTYGGTCTNGDVVGFNIISTSPSFNLSFRHTMNCNATAFKDAASDLASQVANNATFQANSTKDIAFQASFAQSGANWQTYFNSYYPFVSTSTVTITPFTSGGATETVTVAGSPMPTSLELGSALILGHSTNGLKTPVAGDLLSGIIVLGDTSTQTMPTFTNIPYYGSIIWAIQDPTNSAVQSKLVIATPTQGKGTFEVDTGSVILSAPTTIGGSGINTGSLSVNNNETASLPNFLTVDSVVAISNASSVNNRIKLNTFGASSFWTAAVYGGTAASPTAVTNGTELTAFNSYVYNGTTLVGPIASVRQFASQNISAGNQGSQICLATTPNGSTTLANGLCQNNDRSITLGSPTGGAQGADTLNVAGGLFVNGLAVVGKVNAGVQNHLAYYPNVSTSEVSSNDNAVMSSGTLTLGQATSVIGKLILSGNTSGTATIQPQATAGTPLLTLPNTAGTFAVGVTNETNVTLSLSATTGLITPGWTGTLAAGRLNSSVVQGITNDTNLTGSIAAQVLTLAWSGTLAAARLNSNVVQSIVNDTNVTGSISSQALTLGWTGTLAVSRGGTGGGSASGTLLDNISGFASTGYVKRTGAGTYTFSSTIPNSDLTSSSVTYGTTAVALGSSSTVIDGLTRVNLTSGNNINWNSDTYLGRVAAANIMFGQADAASPVAQTISVQNVSTGTSNTAGVTTTFAGSKGTGTGLGGDIAWQTAPAGSTGTTQNTLVTALRLKGTGQFVVGNDTAPNSAVAFQVSKNTAALPAPGNTQTLTHLSNVDGTITRLLIDGFGTGVYGGINYRQARGTAASPSATQSGDLLGFNFANGYGATGYNINAGVGFVFAASQVFTDSAMGSQLDFYVTANGSVTTGAVAHILNDGSLTVGNTTAAGAGGMNLNGQLYMPNITQTSAAQTGTLCWASGSSPAGKFTVDTTLGCLSSSERWKENIRTFEENALDKIDQLQVRLFNWRDPKTINQQGDQLGLIAEEVYELDQRLAGIGSDNIPRAWRQDSMIAMLVKAVQELKQKVERT